MADTVIDQISSVIGSTIDLTALTTDERLAAVVALSKIFLPEWEPNNLDPMFTPLMQLAMHEEAMMAYWYRMEKERDFFGSEIPTNILSHCRSRGYEWSQTTPATLSLNVVFDIAEVGAGKVMAAGSIFTTEYESDVLTDIAFRLLTDVTIIQGQSNADIICSQVSVSEDSFVSTGRQKQEFTLTGVGYVQGSLGLAVNGDAGWEEVTTFAYSSATDKHFIMLVNEDLKTALKFGNGITGAVPVLGALLETTYYVSLGADGRVAADTITIFPAAYDTWITSCTNVLASVGGASPETFAAAKTNALLGLEAKPSDGGTGPNYEYRATTWLRNNIGENKIRVALHSSQNVGIRIVVIMGDENGLAEIPTSYVVTQLQAYFNTGLDYHSATDRVYVEAGSRELQVFTMVVQVHRTEDLVSMRTRIIDFLIEKFSIENINFGGTEAYQPNWRVVKELSSTFEDEVYDVVFTEPPATTEVSADAVPYIDPPEKVQNEGESTYVYAENTSNFTLVVEYKLDE